MERPIIILASSFVPLAFYFLTVVGTSLGYSKPCNRLKQFDLHCNIMFCFVLGWGTTYITKMQLLLNKTAGQQSFAICEVKFFLGALCWVLSVKIIGRTLLLFLQHQRQETADEPDAIIVGVAAAAEDKEIIFDN